MAPVCKPYLCSCGNLGRFPGLMKLHFPFFLSYQLLSEYFNRILQVAEPLGLLCTPPWRHWVSPVAICSTPNLPYDEVSVTRRWGQMYLSGCASLPLGGEWPLFWGKLAF